MRARHRRRRYRGVTLIEVLIALSILALIATLIYGAFDGMTRSKQGLARINDRYHQGRGALARMTRELQSAFLSNHHPIGWNVTPSLMTRRTAFIGSDSTPVDRIDFTSFSHRRLRSGTHESDQNEISYFGSRDPDKRDKLDLARRESRWIDMDPDKGGAVLVLCEDIAGFDAQYLDRTTGEWLDSWDTLQMAGQPDRLPVQVKLTLELRGGAGDRTIMLQAKVPISLQNPLTFANLQ